MIVVVRSEDVLASRNLQDNLLSGERYDVIVTGLLENALRPVEALSSSEQDAIAFQIMETLDDEKAWADRLRGIPSELRDLARAAREERRRRETRPLDRLVG